MIKHKTPVIISESGKKRLTKFVDDCIRNIDNIFEYAGIPVDNSDNTDISCRDLVWNWANDEVLCNMWTKDKPSIEFIGRECERLFRAICKEYNL